MRSEKRLIFVTTHLAVTVERNAVSWEDADSTCRSRGHVLFPGRSYREQRLVEDFTHQNVTDSVWINGWRGVAPGEQPGREYVKMALYAMARRTHGVYFSFLRHKFID